MAIVLIFEFLTANLTARCRSALRQFKCLSEFGPFENETLVTSSPAYCYDVCQFTLDACDSYFTLFDSGLGTGVTAFLLGLPSTCVTDPLTDCIPSEHYSLIDPSYTPASTWNSGPYSKSNLYFYDAYFSPNDIAICTAPSRFGVSNDKWKANWDARGKLRVTEDNLAERWSFTDCTLRESFDVSIFDCDFTACPLPEFTEDELSRSVIAMQIITIVAMTYSLIIITQQLFNISVKLPDDICSLLCGNLKNLCGWASSLPEEQSMSKFKNISNGLTLSSPAVGKESEMTIREVREANDYDSIDSTASNTDAVAEQANNDAVLLALSCEQETVTDMAIVTTQTQDLSFPVSTVKFNPKPDLVRKPVTFPQSKSSYIDIKWKKKPNDLIIAFTGSCFVASLGAAIISYSNVYSVVCDEDGFTLHLTEPVCIASSILIIWAWNSVVTWAAIITFDIYAKVVLEWKSSKLSKYKMPLRLFAIVFPLVLLIPPITGSNLGYDTLYQHTLCLLRNGEEEVYFWTCLACPAGLLVVFVAVMLVQLIHRIYKVTYATVKHAIDGPELVNRPITDDERTASTATESSMTESKMTTVGRKSRIGSIMSDKSKKKLSTLAKIIGSNRRPLIFMCTFCTIIIVSLSMFFDIRRNEEVYARGTRIFMGCVEEEFNSYVLQNGGHDAFVPDYLDKLDEFKRHGGVSPNVEFPYEESCGAHSSPRVRPETLLTIAIGFSAIGITPYLVYSSRKFGFRRSMRLIFDYFNNKRKSKETEAPGRSPMAVRT